MASTHEDIVMYALFPKVYNIKEVLGLSSTLDCSRCGECCKSEKVHVSDRELREISIYLRKKVRKLRKIMHMEENIMHSPCPFFKDTYCEVYKVRPMSCQSYPLFRNPDARLGCQMNCQAGNEMYQRLQNAGTYTN